jgi:hypothetical protein
VKNKKLISEVLLKMVLNGCNVNNHAYSPSGVLAVYRSRTVVQETTILEETQMAVRIVRLGSERIKGEGLRIGTVRRPPRGVPKADFGSQNWYDVWLPRHLQQMLSG